MSINDNEILRKANQALNSLNATKRDEVKKAEGERQLLAETWGDEPSDAVTPVQNLALMGVG